MKLYLSSYGLGDRAADLGRMVAGGKRVGVGRNALDFSSDTDRLEQGRAREFKELEEIGLVPEELDLREYFDARARLENIVARLDALWVVGGNAFVLRRAMSMQARCSDPPVWNGLSFVPSTMGFPSSRYAMERRTSRSRYDVEQAVAADRGRASRARRKCFIPLCTCGALDT